MFPSHIGLFLKIVLMVVLVLSLQKLIEASH